MAAEPAGRQHSVTVPSGQSAQVTVRVAPPAGTDAADDTITLTATSSGDESVFNDDSVMITATPGEEAPPEEPGDTGNGRHHNSRCFVSTAESSNAGILILAVIVIGLGCLVRFRAADARIHK